MHHKGISSGHFGIAPMVEDDATNLFEITHKEGYSQHMMAKVLEMAQSTISGIVERYG